MIDGAPSLVGTLIGDIVHEPGARTKYQYFFNEVARRFPLIEVHDASLRGLSRWINALRVVHPNRQHWRQRFYKNIPAFHARSRRVADYLKSLDRQVDVILQVGVLFDARWDDGPLPSVIYTDYTAHLAAQKPEIGHFPFSPKKQEQWIALEKQAFERSNHICTRSELVRNSILNHYDISPERVTVVGGGVNLAKFPEENDRVQHSAPTVLFIGKDFYRKGGDLLLCAFAQARAHVPEAQLILVTSGPIPNTLPLAGVKIIAEGWNREAIAELYRHADIFVLPSRLETWGDVLLEAMAYRLPCIGVAGEAMEEIIQHGKTGLIVPPENSDALATALIQLLSNEALCRRWGAAGRQRAEMEFTWERVAERLEPIIKATAKVRSPS